jgi:hypothetical protein
MLLEVAFQKRIFTPSIYLTLAVEALVMHAY